MAGTSGHELLSSAPEKTERLVSWRVNSLYGFHQRLLGLAQVVINTNHGLCS